MVSKASEDLPEPETPLTTVSLPWGISQEMFFRLWVRAPRITIASFAEVNGKAPERKLDGPVYRPEGLKAQSSNLHYKLSASDFSPCLSTRQRAPARRADTQRRMRADNFGV